MKQKKDVVQKQMLKITTYIHSFKHLKPLVIIILISIFLSTFFSLLMIHYKTKTLAPRDVTATLKQQVDDMQTALVRSDALLAETQVTLQKIQGQLAPLVAAGATPVQTPPAVDLERLNTQLQQLTIRLDQVAASMPHPALSPAEVNSSSALFVPSLRKIQAFLAVQSLKQKQMHKKTDMPTWEGCKKLLMQAISGAQETEMQAKMAPKLLEIDRLVSQGVPTVRELCVLFEQARDQKKKSADVVVHVADTDVLTWKQRIIHIVGRVATIRKTDEKKMPTDGDIFEKSYRALMLFDVRGAVAIAAGYAQDPLFVSWYQQAEEYILYEDTFNQIEEQLIQDLQLSLEAALSSGGAA